MEGERIAVITVFTKFSEKSEFKLMVRSVKKYFQET